MCGEGAGTVNAEQVWEGGGKGFCCRGGKEKSFPCKALMCSMYVHVSQSHVVTVYTCTQIHYIFRCKWAFVHTQHMHLLVHNCAYVF